jgi:hypothetical protein
MGPSTGLDAAGGGRRKFLASIDYRTTSVDGPGGSLFAIRSALIFIFYVI